MNKIAIAYFSHDGISSLYTGVGTSARDFCLGFPAVKKYFKNAGYELVLFPGTFCFRKTFHGFSGNVKRSSRQIAIATGGSIIEIDNGSRGQISYGALRHWKRASHEAAREIDILACKYDLVIAYSNDTPFAGVSKLTRNENIINIWIPRSTARIHKDFRIRKNDDSRPIFSRKRFEWEKEGIEMAGKRENAWIGYTSKFLKRHLTQEYDAHEDKLLETRVGLYFPRLAQYRKSQHQIKNILKRKGIPTNKELIVSFSRAERYKGLDLTMQLGKYTGARYGTRTVILTIPYSMADPIINELRTIRDTIDPSAIVRFGHDFVTPHYLMQWHKTRIVAVLSRQEPAGLVPSEFRYYQNQYAQLLVSDKDGLPERVTDNQDGFICNIENLQNIIGKADEIMSLPPTMRMRISKNGYRRVLRYYCLIDNVIATLREVLRKKRTLL